MNGNKLAFVATITMAGIAVSCHKSPNTVILGGVTFPQAVSGKISFGSIDGNDYQLQFNSKKYPCKKEGAVIQLKGGQAAPCTAVAGQEKTYTLYAFTVTPVGIGKGQAVSKKGAAIRPQALAIPCHACGGALERNKLRPAAKIGAVIDLSTDMTSVLVSECSSGTGDDDACLYAGDAVEWDADGGGMLEVDFADGKTPCNDPTMTTLQGPSPVRCVAGTNYGTYKYTFKVDGAAGTVTDSSVTVMMKAP
jgi:hypothetical protein